MKLLYFCISLSSLTTLAMDRAVLQLKHNVQHKNYQQVEAFCTNFSKYSDQEKMGVVTNELPPLLVTQRPKYRASLCGTLYVGAFISAAACGATYLFPCNDVDEKTCTTILTVESCIGGACTLSTIAWGIIATRLSPEYKIYTLLKKLNDTYTLGENVASSDAQQESPPLINPSDNV